jgi:hypothetical protein
VPSTIRYDGWILISGLRQSAVRQIAFSLHELIAPAEAAGSWPTNAAKGSLTVKNAG